ncbi:hypothetical protein QA639_40305 [Bradyrhizobium pachyrhizi]|uniref:hypothetical protein n=1 Tax=Bradyrhizobium pachyrhizi TaxID=280333 RepID=UPI0024B1ADAE|nr:hypothetical protein [Bradyrhizobium pachyrhizi]WFU55714.1 hypothetical protein QA639_40305 [Bradyrhizobium pachyrhizi]
MSRHMQRTPLELGLQLNINCLIRRDFIQPGKSTQPSRFQWLDDDGDERAAARLDADLTSPSGDTARCGTMRIQADWINQTVQIVGRPRHFGGVQWYFVCPAQGRHVSVLWSMPRKRYFVGRKALGNQIAYLSQYHSPEARAHYSAEKLIKRTWGPDALDELPKPKWMRWRTYERLSNKLQKFKSEAGVLPRLFLLDGDVV